MIEEWAMLNSSVSGLFALVGPGYRRCFETMLFSCEHLSKVVEVVRNLKKLYSASLNFTIGRARLVKSYTIPHGLPLE